MGPFFEWDTRKAAANRRKLDVSFEEALTVFADPLARVLEDPDHSQHEDRFIIIGRSAVDRLLFVSFARRGDWLRIVSARRATPRERREHEKADID